MAKVFTKAARGNKEDVKSQLIAAHEAFKTWLKLLPAGEKATVLNKIADIMEENLENVSETLKTIDKRKALSWNLELQIYHFVYRPL